MILSIVVNAWPGTDKYRFRLQLETFMHDAESKNDYLDLCKCLLNGWERNKFDIPDDNFRSAFSNFKTASFDRNEAEVILAMDADDKSEIEDVFLDWCHMYNINNQIIRAHIGCAGMRNSAMQIYKGEFIVFRDDDDFSASISKLIKQCKALDFMAKEVRTHHLEQYKCITDRYNYFQRMQIAPSIAIMMDGLKLKNTWGSIDNPFSRTPTPVDVSTIELIERPAFSSMCSKIFTREAISLIYNSTCCGSLEDARSHYLQQLPQHCIWLFEEKQLKWLQSQWKKFRKTKKVNAGVKWLNANVVTYQEWQINSDAKENIDRVDRFFKHNFYISICSPNFIYVLASGSYSNISWSYGSVIGTLEAFRNSCRQLDFTIGDLKRLKSIITSAIKTTLINTNNVSRVEWISSECKDKGKRLANVLEKLANYKYIFWFGIVHGDWNMFIDSMKEIKDLINDINVTPTEGADIVKDKVNHPNSIITVNVNGEDRDLSLCNVRKVKNITDDTNYTETFQTERMIGGESKKYNVICIAILLVFIIISVIIIVTQVTLNRSIGIILTSRK